MTDVERVNVASLDQDEVTHIRARLDVLLAAFDDLHGVDVDRRNEPRARIVVGLTREAHNSADATRVLFDHGNVHDTVTVARRAFEHAVTAAWMVHEKDAVAAFASEKGLRSPRALAETITRAGTTTVSEDALAILDEDLPTRTDEENELRSFERVCATFNLRLYVAYRLLSSHAHPSGTTTAVMFLDRAEDRQEAQEADAAARQIALHTAAASSVWAGGALDALTKEQPHKQRLKQAARDLAISPVLYPGMPDEGRWPI